MIAGLKPYPEMKDSGVPWLGEIPSHWDLKRGKAVFRVIDQRSSTGEEELLTVSSERGVVPRSTTSVTMFKAESYVGHKLCWPGDLVINSLWAWARGLGVSRHFGIVSTAYGVYRVRPEFEGYQEYIHQLARSTAFNWELRVRSKGVWISRLQLTDDAFLGAPFPIPSPGDQQSIVKFLAHVDRRVGRAIRGRQRLIALLEEYRQAVIHRAVTRGLDPDVPLKPSGIEWLGDIPAHWEVRKLRQCGGIVGGMTPSMDVKRFWGGDMPWVTPKDMKRPAIDDSILRVTGEAVEETSLRVIQPPAVLLVVRGMILARRVPIAWTTAPVTLNQDMKAICPNAGTDATFLALLLGSMQRAFAPLIDESGHGTRRLPTERWRDLPLAMPPRPEQGEIVKTVTATVEPFARAADRANREIALLRELSTRLIADVVTGKLDVREAAARLPVGDDLGHGDHGHEHDDDQDLDEELLADEDSDDDQHDDHEEDRDLLGTETGA